MSTDRGTPAVVAALAALTLASCGAQRPAERNSASSESMAQSPPAPAPGAPRAPAAPHAAPVLTAEGFGPLRIGMTRAEVTAALGADADPEAVGGPEPEACDQFRPARAPEGLFVMLEEGRLTRISLMRQSAIKTDRGAGLGSTAAAVKAAYDDAIVSTPHKYRDAPSAYLTHWSRKASAGDVASPTDRGIVFEVDERGVVDLIHAGGPSIQYVEGCL